MKLIIIFLVLQFFNVILQTIKSILTVNGSRFVAATANAIAYGLYTVVIVYTAADFDLWIKIVITVITNFAGVYISKLILDKCRKDRLWEIVATVKSEQSDGLYKKLEEKGISFSMLKTANYEYCVYNIYSKNQGESAIVKNVLSQVGAKYIVHEERAKL